MSIYKELSMSEIKKNATYDNVNRTFNAKRKDIYCMNCNKYGHTFKKCYEPIISCGVILMALDFQDKLKQDIINTLANMTDVQLNKNDNNIGITINDQQDIELFCEIKNKIKFLLIRRKHTLGFLEFIRGRYNIDNVDGIIFLFKQMTREEINKIKSMTFDDLWNEVWGENKTNPTYQNEYSTSKGKFDKLKNDSDSYLSINFYTDNVSPVWNCAEWGFPKGRRNYKESNKECAIREFKEETGLLDKDFIIINNFQNIEENFVGTNGINYRHIYCSGIALKNKKLSINVDNHTQSHEIGDIGFFSYEEAIKKIRPYHTDRQKIITHIFIFIVNSLIDKLKNYTHICD